MKKSVITLFVLFTLAMPMMASEQSPQVERRPKKEMIIKHRPRAMHRKDFKKLCKAVDEASFSERQLELIEVTCISSYFTSKQCVKLLSMLSFDDAKLKALRLLAPRLIDVNTPEIVEQISFSSKRKEAIKILSSCRLKTKENSPSVCAEEE